MFVFTYSMIIKKNMFGSVAIPKPDSNVRFFTFKTYGQKVTCRTIIKSWGLIQF